MASLEKLIKALEAIKAFEPETTGSETKKKEQPLTKKEKISHCSSIADCMCSPSLRNISEFPKFLGIAVETFLMLCDDPESDVRMMADECLNKTIKSLLETSVGRIQVELYKEIKKNGPARSLRAALWRFADLCHLIRPQKCRPYVVNLLPCVTRVCRRPEESIQETLAAALTKICPVLITFTTDAEVKALLRGFLPSLSSSTAATRRTAATVLALVCQNCRKPGNFCAYLLNTLLELVLPVDTPHEAPVLLGVLLALRHLLPVISAQPTPNSEPSGNTDLPQLHTTQLVQVYELLLHHLSHEDHNVVAASLETLQQLLRATPPGLLRVLLGHDPLTESTIHTSAGGDQQSRSRLPSMEGDSDDADLEEDSDYVTVPGTDTSVYTDTPLVIDVDNNGDDDADDSDSSAQDAPDQAPDPARPATVTTETNYANIEIGDVCEDKGLSQSSSMDTLSEARSSVKITAKKYASQDTLSTHSDGDAQDVFPEMDVTPSVATVTCALRDGDIGSLLTEDCPLVYTARLLCRRFLLTGHKDGVVPDTLVRVSVKTLALSCCANILLLRPDIFLLNLHKSSPTPGELQSLQSLLLYSRHHDPQLKGTTALLAASLLVSALRAGRGSVDQWLLDHGHQGSLQTEDLVSLLLSLMEDDSSVVCRLTLLGLKLCLDPLLHSTHGNLSLRVVLALLRLRNNPYWLVKVELLELLASLDFKVIDYLENLCEDLRKGQHHFLGKWGIQEYILQQIFMPLLGDENTKVQQAAANSIVNAIPRLFYAVDHPQSDAVVAQAKGFVSDYLEPIMHDWSHYLRPVVPGLVEPFLPTPGPQTTAGGLDATHSPTPAGLEGALSRVLTTIVDKLMASTSKHLTYGCVQALCVLAQTHEVTEYSAAWCCSPGATLLPSSNAGSQTSTPPHRASPASSSAPGLLMTISVEDLPKGSGGGPLGIILSLLTSTPLTFDLTTHHHALLTGGYLFAGAAYCCLRSPEEAPPAGPDQSPRWPAISDRLLVPLADTLLTHVARVLNICAHIIDDQSPGPPVTKASLPSLPNAPSLSPIKRKARSLKEDASSGQTSGQTAADRPQSAGKESAKEGEKDKVKTKDGLGMFYNSPHYMKLYEVLKGAYSNYLISLDLAHTEKFVGLLRTVLRVLAQLLEVAGIPEVGKHAEELLNYLKSTVTLEDTMSVLCVQQLLKALFGTNLSSQWETSQTGAGSRKPGKATRLSSNVRPGLYHCCFTTPYTQFTQCLASATFRSTTHTDNDDAHNMVQWLKKRAEKKVPSIMKPGSKADKASVAAYIRLFEPLVIKALKQYTITSSLALQQQVLNLLAQLVQLRVNYCLLDSDQIFIGFVIKQFEIIEEGQIRQSEKLIPHIFNFLVLLSYERYHSKSVIGMPKVIQLCDGILASGLEPKAHAIPALRCIVHDLFILRSVNKVDAGKDLETQREFVVSMLLRLIKYYEVLELLILVLYQCRREGEDKWKRLSRQITDTILPLIARQQMNLDNQEAMDIVHRLFESVTPSVFRPVDLLLNTLFSPPQTTLAGLSPSVVQRWLSQLMVLLRVLLNQSKEEMVLARLQELGLGVALPRGLVGGPQGRPPPEDPLTSQADLRDSLNFTTAEETMARFLVQVVGIVIHEISWRVSDVTCHRSSYKFICQELSHYMLYITHMFQSGVYRRVATFAMSMLQQASPSPGLYGIDEIDAAFRSVSTLEPTLTLQWCNILILLNYEDQAWWSDILQTPRNYSITSSTGDGSAPAGGVPPNRYHINLEVVRRGGLVLFCDYVCENLNDAEHVTWVVINHVNDLILLSHEPPVQDFISAIHRNSAASGLFIQAIHSRCEHLPKPSLVRKTLACLEAIHLSQSGALLTLLIDKFLRTQHLAVARGCDTIACRRLEMLLADNLDESINQLPLEDLEKLLQFMKSSGLTKRHRRLASLLNKHRMLLCPESVLTLSPEKTHPLSLTTASPADITIDKMWYVSIVRDQCFSPKAEPQECAELLQHLDYTSILNITMAKECNLSILEKCLSLGSARTLSAVQNIRNSSTDKSDAAFSKELASRENIPDPLLQAAQLTLFRQLNNIINLLPVPHQVMVYPASPGGGGGSGGGDGADDHYVARMEDVLSAGGVVDAVLTLTAALYTHLAALHTRPWDSSLPDEAIHDITRFTILALEVLDWLVHHDQLPSSDTLVTLLSCLSAVLQRPQLLTVLSERMSWVCTAVRAVHQLLKSLIVLPGHKLVVLPHQDSQEDNIQAGFDDMHHAITACDQMSELVHCLRTQLAQPTHPMLPTALVPVLRNVIIGLARLPLVNSYARTPPLVWKMGWLPSPTGDTRTCLPPLPLDYLQERDVLREFIYRVNTLGWTSRQQFEETWMSLLGVLNPVNLTEQEMSREEDIDRCQCAIMATRCITSLLVQSMYTPTSGSPSNSVMEYQPRNKPLPFLNTRVGQKLLHVRGILEDELTAMSSLSKSHILESGSLSTVQQQQHYLVNNLERSSWTDAFTLGQMSVSSIWAVLGLLRETPSDKDGETTSDSLTDSNTSPDSEDLPDLYPPLAKLSLATEGTNRSSAQSDLDINSCLQFLCELFKQLLAQNYTPKTPLMQFNETVKAVVMLSDLFTEKAQFEWMLDTLLEVHRVTPAEDELVMQYLVVGICKAAAVVGMELAVQERVLKLVESCIKSAHLPSKVSALYGALYVLETGAAEVSVPLINTLTEYLHRTLSSITHTTIHSVHHVLVMWSVVFYVLENCGDDVKDGEFSAKMLQLCQSVLSSPEDSLPLPVHLTVLRGLERLLLADVLTTQDAGTLLKLSTDRVCVSSPQRALGALSLMLTCLYSGKAGAQWTPTQVLLDPSLCLRDRVAQDPEALIAAMERVTVLFDRIRKGLPFEASIIAEFLPPFLADFFPPQDIMNKVIGEFLSNQQPHPQLMASVVFRVFGRLLQDAQQTMVQDWVMLSLSNFTQRSPISMATWSLTVFFLSASDNRWLRALLPHVLRRMGKMDTIDDKLFCIAALDFWSELKDSSQRRAFMSTFQAVSKPDTPYAQLLGCLST